MTRIWWRRARHTVALLVFVLAVTLAALGALLGTETGSAWVLAEAAKRTGIELSYAAMRGRLLGRIEFDALQVRSGETRVRVDHAVLHWRPTALFAGRVSVHELRALGVTLTTPPAEADPGEPQISVPALPDFSLPLPVDIALLELSTLRLGGTDAPPVLDTLRLALTADGDTLQIRDLVLTRDRIEVDATITLRLRDDWPLQGRLAVSGAAEDTPLDLRVTLGGSARVPSLELESTASLNVRGRLRADLRAVLPEASAELHWSDAAPGALAPLQSPEGSLLLSLDAGRFEIRLYTRLAGAPGGLSRLTVDARGAFESLQPPFPMEVALDWSAQLDAGAFSGRGSAHGDASALHLEHALRAPFHLTTTGRVVPDGGNTRVDIAGEWRDLAWPPGASEGPASPSGKYRITGTLAALEASVDAALSGAGGVQQVDVTVTGGAALDAPHAFNGELRWSARTEPLGTISGSGSAQGDQGLVRFTHRLSGAGSERVDANGTVTLAPELALDLSGSWQGLRWPLDGEQQASSESGSFAVQGAPGALRTRIEAALEAEPVGTVALRASALVGDREAHEVDLSVDLLGGTVSALGRVAWAPAPGAVLDIRARGIEPARLHPQAVGRLDAHVGVDIRMSDDKPLGSVSLHSLSGTLGDYPVRGTGQVTLTADGFEAREVALGSGDNTLTLAGRIGETLDLRYRIDAPSLHQLWPGLGGAIKGEGTLGGSPAAPLVKAELDADALRMGDARIGALSLRADLNLAEESRSQVRATATGIATAALSVDDAALEIEGTRGAHRVTVAANTSEGRLSLAARGGLRDEAWSGELSTLSLEQTVLGDWRLARPVAITADATGAETGEGCLRSEQASLCLDADRPRPGAQSILLTLAGLSMARFAPWLPPDLSISGGIDASATATQREGEAWSAQANITATPTRIALAAADPPLELSLNDLRLEARHGADGSQARLQGRLGEAGSVRGEVRLGATSDAASPLSGALQATLPDLAPFSALVPALQELAGRLDADLTLGGSTAQPEVRGEVTLSEAGATIPAAGIRIERTVLRLSGGADGRFSVEGVTHSGPGEITLRGEGRIGDEGYNARLSASGTQFEAIKTLQVQALVSPELVIEASPQRIAVTGSVHVPQADIDIQELPPNVVQVSSDEVIRGQEPEPPNAVRERLQVAVDVTLGDAVHVSAFGLDTRLSGGLSMTVQGAASPTARGTVTLVDGRFSAYGQDLQIRRGRLLFAGPLDNPGLDFRAVRDAGEVVAGIEVSGSADRMRSRVFSEPSLPQAEALAWLLTGRGLSGASSDDGSVLASAAVSLGLERSEMVTREIGAALGLDELSVAPGGSLDQSALVLGKALSPRLYIRYALGLLDGEGSVKLDYKLTDRISIEAESGARQGADVMYRLER